jgi:hypothetical protein
MPSHHRCSSRAVHGVSTMQTLAAAQQASCDIIQIDIGADRDRDTHATVGMGTGRADRQANARTKAQVHRLI